MAANRDKPDLWKRDIKESIRFHNEWFIRCAPEVYKSNREKISKTVMNVFDRTKDMRTISPDALRTHPEILSALRMSTCPPIARDRLIGLSDVPSNLVKTMEDEDNPRIPIRMDTVSVDRCLKKICDTILQLLDSDLFVWLKDPAELRDEDRQIAAMVVADRLCGAMSDPIIRNAQERRQLDAIGLWLTERGYTQSQKSSIGLMEPGTFSFRTNVPVYVGEIGSEKTVKIPVDVMVKPIGSQEVGTPLLIEAKSAGDYTNVNKRRKEEAQKAVQLRNAYGNETRFILFLCGYFDAGYLGYEAAEGMDWVWEHRISDLEKFGL